MSDDPITETVRDLVETGGVIPAGTRITFGPEIEINLQAAQDKRDIFNMNIKATVMGFFRRPKRVVWVEETTPDQVTQ